MTVGFRSLSDRLLSCAGAKRSVKSKTIMTRTINRVIFCLTRYVLCWLFDNFHIMGYEFSGTLPNGSRLDEAQELPYGFKMATKWIFMPGFICHIILASDF